MCCDRGSAFIYLFIYYFHEISLFSLSLISPWSLASFSWIELWYVLSCWIINASNCDKPRRTSCQWHNSHSTRTLFLWDGGKGWVQVSKGDQNKIVIGVVIVIICFTWPISRKIVTFLLCNELLALVLMFNKKINYYMEVWN